MTKIIFIPIRRRSSAETGHYTPGRPPRPRNTRGVRAVMNPSIAPSSRARQQSLWLSILSLVVAVIAWETFSLWSGLDRQLVPGPTAVATAFWQDWSSGQLLRHLHTSALEFAWGYSLAAMFGIPVGLFLGSNRYWELFVSPYLLAMYSTPSQAWQPLLIMWFGLTFQSQVLLVFLFTFFVVVINVMSGVKSVDPVYVRLARSYGAGKVATFLKIVIPYTLPFIVSGLRLGVGRAAIGVFLAEFFGSNSGIGFYIVRSGTAFQMDRVFVGVLILILISVLLTEAIRMAEERLTPWRAK